MKDSVAIASSTLSNSSSSSSTLQNETWRATAVASANLSKCEQCALYLKDVFLRRPESRPLEMLLAMGAITKPNTREIQIHPVPNGMAVAIPTALSRNTASALPVPATSKSASARRNTSSSNTPTATIQATSSLKTAIADTSSPSRSSFEKLVILCRPCREDGPEGHARSFMAGPNPSHVVLCSNRLDLSNRQEVEEVLVHELVHAYDAHVQQLDFTTCLDLAYSEVRAAREAECAQSWMMPGHCVRSTAIRATNNLFPRKDAIDCVQEVFAAAMADRKPFSSAATTTVAPAATTKTSPSGAAGTTTSSLGRHPRINRTLSTSNSRLPRNSNDSYVNNPLPSSYSTQQHSQR